MLIDGNQIRCVLVVVLIHFIDAIAVEFLPASLLYKYLMAKPEVLVQCPDVLVAIGSIYDPDHFEAPRVQERDEHSL